MYHFSTLIGTEVKIDCFNNYIILDLRLEILLCVGLGLEIFVTLIFQIVIIWDCYRLPWFLLLML